MLQRTMPWARRVRTLAGLVLLLGASAAAGQEKGEPPAGLPAELVAAWEKTGAIAGWSREGGFPDFLPSFLPLKKASGKASDLPAFLFSAWPKGVVPRLPAPEAPFGLYVGDMTDAGLKPVKSGRVTCNFEFPDLDTAVRGFASAGGIVAAGRQLGEEKVGQVLRESLRQFQRNGRIVQKNDYRYVIAEA